MPVKHSRTGDTDKIEVVPLDLALLDEDPNSSSIAPLHENSHSFFSVPVEVGGEVLKTETVEDGGFEILGCAEDVRSRP